MSADSYIGTMRPFGGIFAIRDWAICQGQLLAISQNTALFSLIGDNYGGDARTTLGLPDMRGRSPVGMGVMPGGRDYRLGMRFGMEDIALTSTQLPKHTHSAVFVATGGGVTGSLQAATNDANTDTPDGTAYLARNPNSQIYYKQQGLSPAPTLTELGGLSVDGGSVEGSVVVNDTGASQSFSILNPLQVVNWQIVLDGIYPSRS
ncbi:microcystin-dependent protein [Pseudoalteromonas sp. CO348]|uniref:phage tail protein n=1 Tax=Pseudoalteromonas sp. CO348 TaxID=1777271 RepID=UPI001023388D|nr:tail fiber protein [Pseudoalteromonas sp. CO348]RZG00152.1 microcystin-dependent protein [Pseudoalteromonas sp. CO348]